MSLPSPSPAFAPSTLRGRTKTYPSSLLIEDYRKKRLGRKSWEVMVEVFRSFMGICALIPTMVTPFLTHFAVNAQATQQRVLQC